MLNLDAAAHLEAEIGQPGYREAHGPVSAIDYAIAADAARNGSADPHERAVAERRAAALSRIADILLGARNTDDRHP